ncbi:hypothetical protein Tpen_1305 [Thermofilum pendens Hrk 5]|uniref:Uncharacterized protein n=1 Tax=Thermofilum pendens (strain DSM 2475 / Hrk 5) TaxID=368408 RepID=A1RZS3_THEPD|nr:hypothetical protein Tpen_1305 [Thermofilum pendens Hrk 5]
MGVRVGGDVLRVLWSEVYGGSSEAASRLAPLLVSTAVFGPHSRGMAELVLSSFSGEGVGGLEGAVRWFSRVDAGTFAEIREAVLGARRGAGGSGYGRLVLGPARRIVREALREAGGGVGVEEALRSYLASRVGWRLVGAVGEHFDRVAEAVGVFVLGFDLWLDEWDCIKEYFELEGSVAPAAVGYAVASRLGELVEPTARERAVRLRSELKGYGEGWERGVALMRGIGYAAMSDPYEMSGEELESALHLMDEASATWYFASARIYLVAARGLLDRALEEVEKGGSGSLVRHALGVAASTLTSGRWDLANELAPLALAAADRVRRDFKGDAGLAVLASSVLASVALLSTDGGARRGSYLSLLLLTAAYPEDAGGVSSFLHLNAARAARAIGRLESAEEHLRKAEALLPRPGARLAGGVDADTLRTTVALERGMVAMYLKRLGEAWGYFRRVAEEEKARYARLGDPAFLARAIVAESWALRVGVMEALLGGDEEGFWEHAGRLVALGEEYEERCVEGHDPLCEMLGPRYALAHAEAVAVSALRALCGRGAQLKPLWGEYFDVDPDYARAVASLLYALGRLGGGRVEEHGAREALEAFAPGGRRVGPCRAVKDKALGSLCSEMLRGGYTRHQFLAVCVLVGCGELEAAKEAVSEVAGYSDLPVEQALLAKVADGLSEAARGGSAERLAKALVATWLRFY